MLRNNPVRRDINLESGLMEVLKEGKKLTVADIIPTSRSIHLESPLPSLESDRGYVAPC